MDEDEKAPERRRPRPARAAAAANEFLPLRNSLFGT